MPDSAGAPLVIGGESRIGSALVEAFRRAGAQPLSTTRRRDRVGTDCSFLDLAGGAGDWPYPGDVSVVYFCAGETSIEACRRDPLRSRVINVDAPVTLARDLHARGARIVYLSTNLVFDGTRPYVSAGEVPSPATEYGRQKLAAERALLALGGAITIVRLTKVVEPSNPLLMGWCEALAAGRAVTAFSDVVVAPVPLTLAIEALVRVFERTVSGIVQVSGDRDVPYVDIARRLAERMGAPCDLVRPSAAPANVARPRHTTLDVSRMHAELGLQAPPWHTVVDQVSCSELARAH